MKKQKTKKVKESLDGLNQGFIGKTGKTIILKDIFTPSDYWTLKKDKSVVYVATHNAVKKIADVAGVRTDPEYTILTQPDVRNNYQQTWQVKICDSKGKCTVEIGESNRSNLGSRGRNNPANMAQKRAFDRAVFRHLGISGFLGEDELPDDEETKNNVDKLTHEDQKLIAPLINEIINSKKKQDLIIFRDKMKKQKGLSDGQLEVLRALWKKQFASFEKSF